MDALNWISARLLISDFIAWVEAKHGESFNHNLFRRAKGSDTEELTDRQKLLLQYATEFVAIEMQKRASKAAQMSEA